MKRFPVLILSAVFVFASVISAMAAATGVQISTKPAKMTKHHSGDYYASNQPTVWVRSSKGDKYDAIDTGKDLRFGVIYKSAYTSNWIVTDEDVKFNGKDDSVNFDPPEKSGNFSTKYIPPKYSMSPIGLCNNEVKLRGQSSMLDGFVVKIPDAYSAQYKVKFKRTVFQNSHTKSDSTNIPAWVVCDKVKVAKADKAKLVPFLKKVNLKIPSNYYKSICPVTVPHMATFTVNSAGNIKYSLRGKDGSKGPSGTLKFTKAGSKTISWKRKIDIAKPKQGSLGIKGNVKYSATTTLDYTLYGGSNKVGSKPPPKKVSFTVECMTPKKATPMKIKTITPPKKGSSLKSTEPTRLR